MQDIIILLFIEYYDGALKYICIKNIYSDGQKKVGEICFITSGLHTCICVTSNKKLMYAKEKSSSESFLAKKRIYLPL